MDTPRFLQNCATVILYVDTDVDVGACVYVKTCVSLLAVELATGTATAVPLNIIATKSLSSNHGVLLCKGVHGRVDRTTLAASSVTLMLAHNRYLLLLMLLPSMYFDHNANCITVPCLVRNPQANISYSLSPFFCCYCTFYSNCGKTLLLGTRKRES